MKKGLMIAIALVVVAVVFVLIVGIWAISTSNKEVRQSNLILSKVADNKSEFDNMWKKIQQVAEVPQAQMSALKDIFISYAQARGQNTSGGSLATWVHESVPNVDVKTFENLMNIITASRDRWTMRQKEIADYIREYNNLFQFPSSIIMSFKGKTQLDPNQYIITSTRTEEAWTTKKDDDVTLFKK